MVQNILQKYCSIITKRLIKSRYYIQPKYITLLWFSLLFNQVGHLDYIYLWEKPTLNPGKSISQDHPQYDFWSAEWVKIERTARQIGAYKVNSTQMKTPV